MKKYALYLVTLILALSCNKKTEDNTGLHPVYPNYFGTVTAVRNGGPYSGKIYAAVTKDTVQCFNLIIDDLRNDGIYWDMIGFGIIPVAENKYNLAQYNELNKNKTCNVLYNGSFDYGSDAVSPNHLDTTFPHFISISKYDPATKEIWGTFECTFVKDHPTSLKPDTVRYSQGEFYTKIQ